MKVLTVSRFCNLITRTSNQKRYNCVSFCYRLLPFFVLICFHDNFSQKCSVCYLQKITQTLHSCNFETLDIFMDIFFFKKYISHSDTLLLNL